MSHSKTSLFLMELIVAILFFSLAGAVVLRMFARSHGIRKSTDALNESVILYNNFLSLYDAYDGNLSQISALMGAEIDQPQTCLYLGYDSNWNPIDINYASFVMVAYDDSNSTEATGVMKKAQFIIFDRKYKWDGVEAIFDQTDFSTDFRLKYVEDALNVYDTVLNCTVSKYIQQRRIVNE